MIRPGVIAKYRQCKKVFGPDRSFLKTADMAFSGPYGEIVVAISDLRKEGAFYGIVYYIRQKRKFVRF